MERLESFVAGALLQRLRQADADADAACTSFRGAVLFVDISNYTVLAETLCGQGADGIEQLGRILDAAFRGHVRTVHDTGGEIACFAGDAFIAYWSADDGGVPRALAQAHDCARSLHVRLRSDVAAVPSTATPASPPLHIGVGAGEIWAARLGDPDRWQLLLAGPAVRDACAAAARAAPGETIVAPAAGPVQRHTGRARAADARRCARRPIDSPTDGRRRAGEPARPGISGGWLFRLDSPAADGSAPCSSASTDWTTPRRRRWHGIKPS